MASNSVGKFARDTSFIENLMEYKQAEIFTDKRVTECSISNDRNIVQTNSEYYGFIL